MCLNVKSEERQKLFLFLYPEKEGSKEEGKKEEGKKEPRKEGGRKEGKNESNKEGRKEEMTDAPPRVFRPVINFRYHISA